MNRSSANRSVRQRCGRLVLVAMIGCGASFVSVANAEPNAMRSFDLRPERHVVVSRDDDLYEAFPDLALLPSGRLLCLYRQSDQHAAKTAQVVLMESDDRGRTWGNRRVVLKGGNPRWNLPRLTRLSGGRLVINGDRAYDNWLVWSEDDGQSWSPLQKVPVRGICPDRIVELSDGTLLTNVERERTDSQLRVRRPTAQNLYQYRSTDGGATWTEAGLIFEGNSSLYAWCGDPLEPEAFRPSSRWGPDDCSQLIDGALRIRTKGTADEVPPVYFLPSPEYHDSVVTIEAQFRVLRNDTGLACTINVADAGELQFFPDHFQVFHLPETRVELDATEFHSYRIVRDEKFLTVFVDGVRRMRTGKLLRSGNARWRHNEKGVWFRRPWGTDRPAFGTTFRAFSHMDYDKWKGSTWRWDNFDRAAQVGRGESHWRSVSVHVDNRHLADTTWSWRAGSGEFPDQYQRDFIVEVHHDPHADYGGSAWVQFPDGEIFVAYYTAEETYHQRPYIMGCYLKPSDFRASTPTQESQTPEAVRKRARRLLEAN